MKKIKSLWRGIFNYHRVVYILYGHAFSERQAWVSFCHRLAEKHNIPARNVMNFFDGTKDNYEIRVEVEFHEDEAG